MLAITWLAVLLGLRFGLEHWAPAIVRASETMPDASEAMAVPPKPAGGLDAREGSEPGEGTGESTAITPATCERVASALRNTCWQALARQVAGVDPDEALRTCELVLDPEMLLECRADVAESIAGTAPDRATTICATIGSTKWRGQCHFGIGLATAETDPEYAIARCSDAEIFQTFCRHDVVGEIALVNLPAASSICAREEGDWLTRKTCWHGIGKYLARRDMVEAAKACEAATLDWRGTCFHGVGWGGAERDVDASLAACTTAGPYADNCKHGVANEQKRIDPARAVALCESIARTETRTRCLDFVTR